MIDKFMTLLIIVFILLGAVSVFFEYRAAEKYFPGMTVQEFIFLGDKIRITPTGNK